MFPEGRLFDFLIVGAVALMVVGPKDLPILMRKVGQFMARVRGMAAEFRASFDELARQSELDELRREVEALRTARPMDYAAHAMGGDRPGVPRSTPTWPPPTRRRCTAAAGAGEAPSRRSRQRPTPSLGRPSRRRQDRPQGPAAE